MLLSLGALKVISYVLLALLCVTAFRSAQLGLRFATDSELRKPYKSSELLHKKRVAWAGLAILLVLVLVVEYTVRLAKPDHSLFAWFHIFFAVSLLFIALAIVLWKSGLQDPRLHRWFAYGYLACLAIVAVSGVLLMHGLR